MSTDYDAICTTCKRSVHLGQRFTSGFSFGFGTNDLPGHRAAGTWVLAHLEKGHQVGVDASDAVPDDYERDDLAELRRASDDDQHRAIESGVLVVHALREGFSLCGDPPGIPATWPKNHRWTTAPYGAVRPNCETCSNMLDVEDTTRER